MLRLGYLAGDMASVPEDHSAHAQSASTLGENIGKAIGGIVKRSKAKAEASKAKDSSDDSEDEE